MAVTRIKNNQITDGTIEAGKIANTTITGGKLANDLTYGSNLTISGNLTVNGTTTTVDTTNTVIADPLLLLSRGATGSASVDAGLIVERGDDDNVAFVWDESADQWVAAITSAEDGSTTGNVTIDSYANLKVGSIETTSGVDITGDLDVDNLNLNGNTIISTDTNGDINLTPNGTGEVVAATLTVSDLTDNRIVIAGSSGALEDDGNLTFDGTTLAATAAVDITGDLDVDNININGNTIISTDTNGDINVTPDGTGEVVLSTAAVSDLTDNRVVIAGTSGALEDDANFTYDGTDLTVNSAIVSDLTDNRIVVAGTSGALEDDANLTWDGTDMGVTGGLNVTGDLAVDNIAINGNTISSTDTNGAINLTPNGTGEVVAASATVSDLTSGRVILAGTSGALEDDANLTYDGTDLSTNSLIVGDLTDNRVLIAGTSGAVEDDANFTFNGTTLALTAGMDITGDLDVDNININGNTIISTDTNGNISLTPNGTGEVVLSTAVVSDLTDNRIVVAGTAGALEDDANLTWDGSDLDMTGGLNVTGDITIDNMSLNGNTLASTDTNGAVNVTPDGTGTIELGGTSTVVNVNGTTGSTGTNNGSLVIDGGAGIAENLYVGGNIVLTGNLTVQGTTTTVDSTTTTVVDPIFQIGGATGGGTLSSDDSKDRGMSAKYYDGAEKTAFWGYDNSTGYWTFVPDATISGEVVSGSKGTLDVGSILNANLTDNRVVIAGTNGVLEDDANFTFNGTTLALTAAMDITGDLDVDNININGNTIISTDTNGDINLTPDGTGDVVASTLTVSDLTDNRIVVAGTSGALEDDANLTWDGSDMGVTGGLNVTGDLAVDNIAINGNTISSTDTNGAINLTPDGTGEVVAASATVSDLTSGRIVTAGTSGALEDSASLTWDGTDLTAGSAIISDLTDNRVVIAGTSGALEDDANFTFNGTTLALTAAMDITGDLDVDNININGNTIISTDTNGDINITPNGTGEVVASTLTVSDLTDNRVVLAGTSGALEDSANFTFDGTTVTMTAAVDVTGDLDVDNVNINGNTIISTDTNGNINLTPNGTGEVVASTLTVSDITDNRVVIGGTSGALEDSGNLTFDGTTLTVTGNIAVDNITLDGNDITATSGGKVTVNDAGADVDFTVEGDTDTALLHVDAGTDTVNIGTATATTGAKLKINSTDSMIIPTGSTAQRPGTGVEGMLRINSSTFKMEYYANSEWKTADSAFTVIASETFDGDDSTVAFTLSDSQTTASCIVAINGVLQLPVTAYGVSGTTLTFTEAPASGDKIEVRKLTTTTTITDIASADGYQTVEAVDATGVQISTGSSAQNLRWTFNTSGHLVPNGDEVFDIGTSSNKVRSLYVGGGTVFLGDLQLKDNGDNTLGIFQSDGTTPAGTVVNDFVTGDQGDVRFMDADSSNFVALQAPATVASNVTWTLPDEDASVSGYALVSDGAGTLSWAAAGATISQDEATNTNFNLYFASTTSGALTAVKYDSGLNYNPSTGTLTTEDMVVSGDLTVNGTTTTISTTNTVVSDNLIELNNGAASNANDSGIVIERGSTGDNAFIGWDESADKFIVGTTTATGASTGDLTITSGTLVAATFEGDLTGDVTGNADTATEATNVTATANNATDETTYITFVDGATGTQGIETDTGLTYNPSSNTLTTSIFSGTATTAQYADLAEMYASDSEIKAGTVVHFAGNGKVAACNTDMCSKVAGIVSTDPAHLMNSSQDGVPLALAGRVPCKVVGPVNAGDLMVSAGNGMARAEADPKLGTVIGKAIEDFSGEGEGVIEVLALMM